MVKSIDKSLYLEECCHQIKLFNFLLLLVSDGLIKKSNIKRFILRFALDDDYDRCNEIWCQNLVFVQSPKSHFL